MPSDFFYLRKGSKDGFANQCMECKKQQVYDFYAKNKVAILRRRSTLKGRRKNSGN